MVVAGCRGGFHFLPQRGFLNLCGHERNNLKNCVWSDINTAVDEMFISIMFSLINCLLSDTSLLVANIKNLIHSLFCIRKDFLLHLSPILRNVPNFLHKSYFTHNFKIKFSCADIACYNNHKNRNTHIF